MFLLGYISKDGVTSMTSLDFFEQVVRIFSYIMGAVSGVSARVATTVMSRVDLKAKNLQQSLPLLRMVMIVVVVVE